MGELALVGDHSTVPLTRVSCNTVFSKSQNARKAGTLCTCYVSKVWWFVFIWAGAFRQKTWTILDGENKDLSTAAQRFSPQFVRHIEFSRRSPGFRISLTRHILILSCPSVWFSISKESAFGLLYNYWVGSKLHVKLYTKLCTVLSRLSLQKLKCNFFITHCAKGQ